MSFFKSVKSWLNQDCGGRYVSCILQELLSAEPKIAIAIFGRAIDFTSVDVEVSLRRFWPYLRCERRADVALLDARGQIVALIEVKYEDQKSERNHAQISDYVRFCKNYGHPQPVPFAVVTKSSLPEKEERLIVANAAFARCISYRDIVRGISQNNLCSPVAKMVKEYFEEETLMFNPVDKNALQLLMLRSLNVSGSHGLGRQLSHYNVSNAPKALEAIISNTEIIGDHIYHNYMPDKFSVRPITDFRFTPTILKQHIPCAKQDLEDDREIGSGRIFAGKFWAYYYFPLRDGQRKWKGYLDFGFYSDLNAKRKSEPLKTFLYANVFHRDIDHDTYVGYSQIKINIERITEDKATKLVCRLLKDVTKESLHELKLSRGVQSTLHSIYKNISGR
jgi:hypothetical protein